jgi:hypothetical protein
MKRLALALGILLLLIASIMTGCSSGNRMGCPASSKYKGYH